MRRSLIILAILTAMLAAACGGEDAGDIDSADDAASAVESAVDEAAATAEDAVAGINSEACAEASEALTAVPAAIAGALTGQGDMAATAEQAQALSDLADDVPEEYQADFQVIADTYSEVATTLQGVEVEPGTTPDAETQAALTDLSSQLSDDAFTTAVTNVSGFFAAGCQ